MGWWVGGSRPNNCQPALAPLSITFPSTPPCIDECISQLYQHAGPTHPPTCHAVQDVGVGDDDAQVNVDRRHQPALQRELAKLDSLEARTGQGCWRLATA